MTEAKIVNLAETAFYKAISDNRLSSDKASSIYAGEYMYMGKDKQGKDLFKNRNTREYIK